MNKKGYIYTLTAIMLVIVIIFIITFYFIVPETEMRDVSGKIRCDELHYFVEDVKVDLDRAMGVCGRRATIYAIDYVIYNKSASLANFSYVTPYSNETLNGSEAAILELIYSGTLEGEPNPYMQGNSLIDWVNKMEVGGTDAHFNVTIKILNISIAPYDAWNFTLIPVFEIDIRDETGMCHYKKTNVTIVSVTTIVGLEDPLYPLQTSGAIVKIVDNGTVQIVKKGVIGCGEGGGNGDGTGKVSTGGTPTNPDHMIRVITGTDLGIVDPGSYTPSLDDYAGVVSTEECNQTTPGNVTVPYILDTGEYNESAPSCNCSETVELNASEGDCIFLSNGDHVIKSGTHSIDFNTSGYYPSTVEVGPSSNYSLNGPSFFDRLEGNLNLSEKYFDRHVEFCDRVDELDIDFPDCYNTPVGLESFVFPYDLDRYDLYDCTNCTWVDYLYWQGKYGCLADGVCKGVSPTNNKTVEFRIDDDHRSKYNLTC